MTVFRDCKPTSWIVNPIIQNLPSIARFAVNAIGKYDFSVIWNLLILSVDMTKRIGATSRATIDPAILLQLNQGILPTATLSEVLAVDFADLMRNGLPTISTAAITQMQQAAALGVTKRMELAATILSEQLDPKKLKALSVHPSDTVRGWAAYCITIDPSLNLESRLNRVRPFADDAHFGVREWAWLAVRPAIAQEIERSIDLLLPWTADSSANIRRFAIEVTRPRGVWSKHISKLKTAPSLGEDLLDRVMEDGSRYVQDSCANWLNDASKSNPDWVIGYCEQWRQKTTSDAMAYITRKALHSINSSKT
jgi:3-methyladenine DNA glycosylase AlkC